MQVFEPRPGHQRVPRPQRLLEWLDVLAETVGDDGLASEQLCESAVGRRSARNDLGQLSEALDFTHEDPTWPDTGTNGLDLPQNTRTWRRHVDQHRVGLDDQP